jgi:hypothetical protein
LCKEIKALKQAFDELNASHESLKEDHEELGKAHKKLEKSHSTLLNEQKEKEHVVTCDKGSFVFLHRPNSDCSWEMGSPSDLVKRLDFSVGKDFKRQVHCRFGTQVHHVSSSPRGSFLLLAMFRRSLFHLKEESVALVLQSYLGGSTHHFHVFEVSHNHFCFSVSCKAVGFFVYELRRVIGDCFDVYFHR